MLNADKDQYRVFIYSESSGTKEELTNGYTNVVAAKIPYVVNCSKIFTIGHYKLITWVREAGSNNEYDSTYTANLNCANRDDNNRLYANDNLIIDKETYQIGGIVKYQE